MSETAIETSSKEKNAHPKLADKEKEGGPAILRVRAILPGYYDHIRRRLGDIFTLRPYQITVVDPLTRKPALDDNFKPKMRTLTVKEQFSGNWMEPVADDEEETLTSAQAALDDAQREIRDGRHPSTAKRRRE